MVYNHYYRNFVFDHIINNEYNYNILGNP